MKLLSAVLAALAAGGVLGLPTVVSAQNAPGQGTHQPMPGDQMGQGNTGQPATNQGDMRGDMRQGDARGDMRQGDARGDMRQGDARGDMRQGDMRNGNMRGDTMHGGMGYHHRWHRHCRVSWHHHHRVRVCR